MFNRPSRWLLFLGTTDVVLFICGAVHIPLPIHIPILGYVVLCQNHFLAGTLLHIV